MEEDVGAVADHAEACEEVEVDFVVLGAEEEEVLGEASVGAAEGDGGVGAAVDDEGVFEHVGFVLGGVEEGDGAGEGGAAEVFAFFDAGEEAVFVPEHAGGVGEVDHVADDFGAGFALEGGFDGVGDHEFGEEGVFGAEVVVFGGGQAVEVADVVAAHAEEALGGPAVDVVAAEAEAHADAFEGDFVAFDEEADGLGLQMQVLGEFIDGEDPVRHGGDLWGGRVEPKVGIEPTTYSLRVNCSTD